jgi:hypothetical protein
MPCYQGETWLAEGPDRQVEKHFRGCRLQRPDRRSPQPLTVRVWCRTRARGCSQISHPTTLTAQLAEALAGMRKPRARHDPGRVLVEMAFATNSTRRSWGRSLGPAQRRGMSCGAARGADRRGVLTGDGGRSRAARAGHRPGRVCRGLSQREGGARGADIQEDVRPSPDVGILRQHRRVPGRTAAAWQRQQQHRSRPHRRPRRVARAISRTITAMAPRS